MTGEPQTSVKRGSDRLEIASINKFYYPKIGGIENVVRSISEGLVEEGHQARVVAAVPRGWGRRERYNGVSIRKAGSLGVVKSVPIAPEFPKHLHDAVQTADIVHHHLPNPLGPVSEMLVPSGDAKRVVTYHSDIVRQKFALQAYKPVLKRFLASADRIIVTSPNLRDNSEFLSPHAEKCDVVPLSVPLEEYGTYNGPDYNLPLDENENIVLFVGRLNYYKGVTHLIDAMAEVDGKLLVVGDGNRREALKQQTREAGLDDSIVFLGRVEDELLHYCYSVADLFVLPSVAASEAFGIVQLEAMAYGAPVVNTALPTGVPWVSVDGETGRTVPPGDSSALGEAIQSLLSDSDTRQRFGENARKRVEKNFSRTDMLESIRDIYGSVLDS